jgi:hypothetical protein
MDSERLNIIISPEVLDRDIFNITYDGNTFGVYSGLTQVLSGGTNGDSLLTGLTIPILFTQSYNDIGYYSDFDGLINQQDVVTNFVISGTPITPYTIRLYNSAGYSYNNFLDLATYKVDWGDGLVGSVLSVNESSLILLRAFFALSLSVLFILSSNLLLTIGYYILFFFLIRLILEVLTLHFDWKDVQRFKSFCLWSCTLLMSLVIKR